MNITQTWPDGWLGHEQQQRERESRWSFDEKLQWLEDAHRMVLELEKKTSQPDFDTESSTRSA